ncbi:MAG: hypothetical protein AABX54_00120 [Nanoarchaeota archaeon]
MGLKNKITENSRAQVWIETVIYTLIGLAIIAILLSITLPQVDKMKDRTVMTQATDMLNILNSKILETEESPGNIRIANIKISRGKLEIDSKNNTISYIFENTRLEPTEIGESVKEGNVIIETKKSGDKFNVILKIDYNNVLNISYGGRKETKILHQGTSPYKIIMQNLGYSSGKTNIDFDVG